MTTLKGEITARLSQCKDVLDLCAGTGDLLNQVKGNKYAVELNPKYNKTLLNNGYRFVLNEDVTKIGIEEHDAITMLDGIEHLEYKQGLALIEEIEDFATKMILIFTPNEFNDNKHNADKLGEPLQEHKSLWPEEFWIDRGYTKIYTEYNPIEKVNNNLYMKRRKDEK